jgi:hypothetical protein
MPTKINNKNTNEQKTNDQKANTNEQKAGATEQKATTNESKVNANEPKVKNVQKAKDIEQKVNDTEPKINEQKAGAAETKSKAKKGTKNDEGETKIKTEGVDAVKKPKAKKSDKTDDSEPKPKRSLKKSNDDKQPTKPKKSKKKDINNDDNENDEELTVDGKHIRSFKVKLPESDKYEGRFTGLTPYQAANKALSKFFRESNKPDAEITFSICESTRKSKKSTYTYVGRRLQLEVPVKYKIQDGREIVKNFKNSLKKVKKADQLQLAI